MTIDSADRAHRNPSAPRRSLAVLAAVTAAVAASGADASVLELGSLRLDAFGTLGAVHSDYKEADYVSNSYFQPKGAGYTSAWSTYPDTRVGLQATYAFTDKLTGVVQGISAVRYDNTYTPRFEWANLAYQLTDDLNLRAGRFLAPTYLTSETQNVGYASYWARTPAEIFIELPISNIDGAQVTYRKNIGQVSNQVQLFYGSNKTDVVGNWVYQNTGIVGIADTIGYDSATIHLGYQKMGYTFSNGPETRGDNSFHCLELGATYDPGSWYVTGELFNTVDSDVGNNHGWYLGGGVRFGAFTVYANHAKQSFVKTGDLVSVFGDAHLYEQSSSAAGVRWDFYKNLDLKVQYDRAKIGSPMLPVSFVNVQPNSQIGDVANVVTVNIDFVW